ncbi:uncharacterized protein KY384_004852 [Bacidia gigantensis]|uniref:uncharacterized protein n=1 Tax=Bacidia gigantensis TaxID=2732470 RepID=UPI001D04AA1B|nr:uncharacterized protein KY384_004852 [Bacidia gigantensis]KAG8530350.1 hypothetical protein KY384_004852 [Bacidia gigantensis]
MPLQEDAVLQPKDIGLKCSDDWPTFYLTKANITSVATGEPVSLLSAHKGNPVKVSGRLEEVDEELAHLVRHEKYKKHTIELSNVTVFAFAEFEDETYGFWAAGQAGWYDIGETVPSYKPVLDEMSVEASMIYFLADKVRRSRKTKYSATEAEKYVRRLFSDYHTAGKYPARFADVDDVRDSFHNHRDFLITSMLEGQEGIQWTDSAVFAYFNGQFPDDVKRISSRVFETIPPDPVISKERKRKSTSPPTAETMPKRKKGRPRKDELLLQRTPVGRLTTEFTTSDDDGFGAQSGVSRKRKSILRPSGTKYSRKGRKAAGKIKGLSRKDWPSLSADDAGEDDDDEALTPTVEDSPIITIKNGNHLNRITNPPSERPLHDDDSPPPEFIPRKFLELRIVEHELPTLDPQGPGDLWTCTFEGCGHRVHSASANRKKIRDHFKSHKIGAQEKIDLALDESKPYLPVK